MTRRFDRSRRTAQPSPSSDSTARARHLDPATVYGQITFLPTADLAATDAFYTGLVGLPLVRDQGVCRIYGTAPGAYLGFCERGYAVPEDHRVVLTLLVEGVAASFERLRAGGVRARSQRSLRGPHGVRARSQRLPPRTAALRRAAAVGRYRVFIANAVRLAAEAQDSALASRAPSTVAVLMQGWGGV